MDQNFRQSKIMSDYQMRRLPLLMAAGDSEFQLSFQWPEQKQIDQIMKDGTARFARLKIWENESGEPFMEDIQFILSSKESSKQFQNQLRKPNLYLKIDRQVRKVEIKCNEGEQNIYGLKFIDKDERNIAEWNQEAYEGDAGWIEQAVPKGESLIGIYGNYNCETKRVVSLGFITLKNQV